MLKEKILKTFKEFFKLTWGKFILSISIFLILAIFISAQCPGLYSRTVPTELEKAKAPNWKIFPIKGISCETLLGIASWPLNVISPIQDKIYNYNGKFYSMFFMFLFLLLFALQFYLIACFISLIYKIILKKIKRNKQ